MRRILVALALVMTGPAHAAQKPPPAVAPLQGPIDQILIESCFSGETKQLWVVNYIQPPNDVYYTLITPKDCPSCESSNRLQLNSAHVVLHYPAPCLHHLIVSVVGSTGDSACRRPDPTAVLWGPVDFEVYSEIGTTNHYAPLPLAGPTIFGPAFLRVEIPALGSCSDVQFRPRLVTSGTCGPCESFNYYPGHEDDLCDLLFPGRPVMYVEASGCDVVPTLRRSWGQLRSIYR